MIRVRTMLIRFASSSPLDRVLGDLQQLLDDHTEYFRANIEALEGKMRRVLLALAGMAAGAVIDEVGRRLA